MTKIIWTLWLQGETAAPPIVRHCLESWRTLNPEWDVRCLDADTIRQYVDIPDAFNPDLKDITATSFSDMVRLLLLYEYGGVWVDATCFCNKPLDEFLADKMDTGFFAFSKPAPDRPLASWFLAAQPHNIIIATWLEKALEYWDGRRKANAYFWLHNLLNALLKSDENFTNALSKMPEIGADQPHSLLHSDGFSASPLDQVADIDWQSPLFKLSYRLNLEAPHPQSWVGRHIDANSPAAPLASPKHTLKPTIASLKVGTENLGDHVQILGQQGLAKRFGITPDLYIDRDNELETAQPLEGIDGNVPIILNGWFKSGHSEWPPHPKLTPLILGFHIRTFQCPPLLESASIAYFQKHAPIGARDTFTANALQARGVEAYVSGCLSQSMLKRLPSKAKPLKTFVVSRDDRILSYLPDTLGELTFINHYSDKGNFQDKMKEAQTLLKAYKEDAKLIITTLLHCALPAIAMGIPVIVFAPLNTEAGHASDMERFSSLKDLTPIYDLTNLKDVDWAPSLIDTSDIKLGLRDKVHQYFQNLDIITFDPVANFAAAESLLPGDECEDHPDMFLPNAASDKDRWGKRESYNPQWGNRAQLAATFIPDNARIFEIGVGAGQFRDIISTRTHYRGADLEPLEASTLRLDLEVDPLPELESDFTVVLGVLEYVNSVAHAIAKICNASENIVITYCFATTNLPTTDITHIRHSRKWVNNLTRDEFIAHFQQNGFSLKKDTLYEEHADFQQNVMLFTR